MTPYARAGHASGARTPQSGGDDLFDRARSADIEAVAGVKLHRAGRRMRGECPLCHASGAREGKPAKRAGGAFSVDVQAGVFKCWGCLKGGDVIRLEQLMGGGTAREAAERLAGVTTAPPRARAEPAPRPAPGDLSPAERVARETWAQAWPGIAGTIVETYLRGRGIAAALIAGANGRLRYHPQAKWGWDATDKRWVCAPAMVAQVVGPGGPTGGVHVTYLRPDGSGKARLDPAKRMWGPQRDRDGRPGGVWLTAPDAPGPLLVGEGVESTLSAGQLQGRPCRLVAALSLGALQGEWLTDAWGRIDPAALAGDPERPGFTWPGQDQVLVAVDRDMSPIEVKVRKLGGGTVRRRLSADERARICAGLALQAWRAAGTADVRAIAPGAGRDFNDELMGRLA